MAHFRRQGLEHSSWLPLRAIHQPSLCFIAHRTFHTQQATGSNRRGLAIMVQEESFHVRRHLFFAHRTSSKRGRCPRLSADLQPAIKVLTNASCLRSSLLPHSANSTQFSHRKRPSTRISVQDFPPAIDIIYAVRSYLLRTFVSLRPQDCSAALLRLPSFRTGLQASSGPCRHCR